MRTTSLLLRILLACALLLAGCAVEVRQTAGAPDSSPGQATSASPLSASADTTRVPLTWNHLALAGRLVYLSNTMEGGQTTGTIQMLDLQTGQISTLFRSPGGWAYYASVSPDARWLVMSYAPPAQGSSVPDRILYRMPLDGSAPPQPLFTPPAAGDRYTQVEWSPDGKYLYFVHYNHDQAGGSFYETYEIFRMSYPDGAPEKIVDEAFWPRLSADSARLVYISLDPASGTNELWLADADGSQPQKIALSGSLTQDIIDAPIFSPDGNSILFSVPSPVQSQQPGWMEKWLGVQVVKAHNVPSDWWSVPVAGGTPVRLTNIQAVNLFASLSPDRKRIASLSGEGIFVMDLDGSNLTQLISDPQVHGTVSWIP